MAGVASAPGGYPQVDQPGVASPGWVGHYVRVVLASPTPRRVKTPSWLDLRLVLGVVLVLVSVLVGATVVAGADHSYRMLAVKHDLAAGTVLRADDVTAVSVRVPDRARYLASDAAVAGRHLNRPLTAGELLPAAALSSPPALTTLTVPFADGQAPKLAGGQRIQVWLSTKVCRSIVLLAEAAVQDVGESGGGAFTTGSGQNVTLSLPAHLAERVVTALALDDATIRAGVLSGPSQAAGPLPSLESCVTPAP